VYVPLGWEADGGAGLRPGLAQVGAAALQRAEAQYHISAALARQAAEGAGAEPLAEAQRRFYAECRRARDALDAAGAAAPARPAGRGLQGDLQDLLERNKELAKQHGFDDAVRAEAERVVEAGGGPVAGVGARWEAEGVPFQATGDAGAAAPVLTLTPAADRRARGAWPASGAWLGLLTIIGLFSLWPAAAAWSRALWPEQVGLVGLVGWWAAGATPVVLALLLLAAGGRAWAAASGAGRILRRPAKSGSTAPMPALPGSSGT